jgi:hypothetical protein
MVVKIIVQEQLRIIEKTGPDQLQLVLQPVEVPTGCRPVCNRRKTDRDRLPAVRSGFRQLPKNLGPVRLRLPHF